MHTPRPITIAAVSILGAGAGGAIGDWLTTLTDVRAPVSLVAIGGSMAAGYSLGKKLILRL